MLVAKIKGRVTSTVKHRSMQGQKLMVAQELDRTGKPTGDPLVIVDQIGAGVGDIVMISSDGKGVAERLKDENTPVRWFTLGLADSAGKLMKPQMDTD